MRVTFCGTLRVTCLWLCGLVFMWSNNTVNKSMPTWAEMRTCVRRFGLLFMGSNTTGNYTDEIGVLTTTHQR
ncbi:hypothetical protein T484DRAFT_2414204 [Baffinella frigidus]|nr:hypothetical protein T484DRAFT_2414204 [Cryptophyta sp. CCMP2293]